MLQNRRRNLAQHGQISSRFERDDAANAETEYAGGARLADKSLDVIALGLNAVARQIRRAAAAAPVENIQGESVGERRRQTPSNSGPLASRHAAAQRRAVTELAVGQDGPVFGADALKRVAGLLVVHVQSFRRRRMQSGWVCELSLPQTSAGPQAPPTPSPSPPGRLRRQGENRFPQKQVSGPHHFHLASAASRPGAFCAVAGGARGPGPTGNLRRRTLMTNRVTLIGKLLDDPRVRSFETKNGALETVSLWIEPRGKAVATVSRSTSPAPSRARPPRRCARTCWSRSSASSVTIAGRIKKANGPARSMSRSNPAPHGALERPGQTSRGNRRGRMKASAAAGRGRRRSAPEQTELAVRRHTAASKFGFSIRSSYGGGLADPKTRSLGFGRWRLHKLLQKLPERSQPSRSIARAHVVRRRAPPDCRMEYFVDIGLGRIFARRPDLA